MEKLQSYLLIDILSSIICLFGCAHKFYHEILIDLYIKENDYKKCISFKKIR